MREMHKWKDKVELSLDNRQIFFLFFGLSVIGCFVFALGIMTGRRINWEPGQEVAAVSGSDSLALLEAQDEHFDFETGLAASDAEAIPPTRDPSEPPRDEKEVRAERAAAAEQAKSDEQAAAAEQREAAVAEVNAKMAEQEQALAQVSDKAQVDPAKAAKPTNADKASGGQEKGATKSGEPRRFTLQMKAFSRQEDADKLAASLRSNGQDVRIESHEVRGRTWHRVRLGAFDTWEGALAAKQNFESSEHIIAYVVSL